MRNAKNIPLKFLLLGFAFGMLFPLTGIVADCFIFNKLSFTWADISGQIANNPIHYIIFMAPLILGGTFYAIGWFAFNESRLNLKLTRTNTVMKETNELLDTFNYHVSHDLKTILNNQLALAKMSQKYLARKDTDKLEEIVEKMIGVGENGLATVAHFLVMSKEGYLSDSESAELQFREEIYRILIESGCEDRIKVSFGKTDFEKLTIQPKVFESIFVNLLTNTIKYNNNKPEVTFELIKVNGGKHIIYRDNGIGIDMDKYGDKVFEPFQRIQNEQNQEGTGVGLFIVRKLVQAYSGKISLESKLGEGVKFDIYFPDLY